MLIKVKVKTKIKRPYFKELKEGEFEVGLKEKREQNLANKALVNLLKDKFPNKRIKIISGLKSPSKIIEIALQNPISRKP